VASILQPGSGSFWQFYEANLKSLLIQQGTQWVAAPSATVKPTPQFLQFFNRLALISAGLFPHGASAPTLQFNAHVLRSPGIQSVTFALDGQKLSGADVTKQFNLTVQSSQEAQLLATYGGNNLPLQFTGNWALFHLVDHGHVEQASNPLRLAYPLEISGTPIVLNGLPLTERIEFYGPGANVLSSGARSELQCVSQIAR
jgi:type VI secretion system protein ImpL